MKAVKIVWMDSAGVTNRWEFIEDMDSLPPSEITSVGFLLEDAPDYKTIVQSASMQQMLGRMTIPAGCIKSVTVLAE